MSAITAAPPRTAATGRPIAAQTCDVAICDAAPWNDYVARRAGASAHLYHRAEWEAAFGVYGLPYHRLAAFREGQVVGVLPLVWQRSLLFGSRLVSLPWFDTAGVLADDGEALAALVEQAVELARQCGAASVELRHADASAPSTAAGSPAAAPASADGSNAPTGLLAVSSAISCSNRGFAVPAGASRIRDDKVLLRLRLEADPDALWKRLAGKVRNQVRKGQKSGLRVESGGRDLLDRFFDVYSTNMRDLGSPSHSRRFFEAVWQAFPRETRIYVVSLDGAAIGAGWTMANGRRLEIPWASSLNRYNPYCVNHVMYWELLADACRGGLEWLHFGRSTVGSGQHHFKKQWGADEVPLAWYKLCPGQPDEPLCNGTNGAEPHNRFAWGTRLWQRLPVWLSRRLGPRIISKVP
ncbi:MAG TPA: GNAT family N-acetyltransferase [Planctomycetaceae bacterium]|nr:GNAT family N-acetyltransferase [Planctomycetaceae bacterium]